MRVGGSEADKAPAPTPAQPSSLIPLLHLPFIHFTT